MHAMKVVFYLARLTVYRQLAFARFFSKPGSRIIVPVLLVGFALLVRDELRMLMDVALFSIDRSLVPEDEIVLDILLGVLGVAIIYAYVLFSRALAVVLGAFPVAKRPLPPVRRLRVVKQDIRPAVVRVAVPALPRRRTSGGGL